MGIALRPRNPLSRVLVEWEGSRLVVLVTGRDFPELAGGPMS